MRRRRQFTKAERVARNAVREQLGGPPSGAPDERWLNKAEPIVQAAVAAHTPVAMKALEAAQEKRARRALKRSGAGGHHG